MKILLVAEKEGTAIHRLSVALAKSAPWHDFRIVCVHPKRPSPEQIRDFTIGSDWADIIHFQYWKTAEMLKSMFNISKINILTHHNPYDLERSAWESYNEVAVFNTYQQQHLKRSSKIIRHAVDLDFWAYPKEGEHQKIYHVNMVANRIEGKKGVREVAQVVHELGLRMSLVGSVSDPTYFAQMMDKYGENIDFFEKIPDEQLRQIYYNSMIHVCNSIDNYESGTMPILEAMACGTPVLTRKIGHVPDTFNGRNMIVRQGQPEDIEDLRTNIKTMIEDPATLKDLAREGRSSLRYSGLEIYAREYSKLYHKAMHNQPLVSVVLPVASSIESWKGTLAHILAQTYPAIELIIVDDGENNENEAFIEEIKKTISIPIKYYKTAIYKYVDNSLVKIYGLAHARNKAILESEGQYLCFIDERQVPELDAIEKFAERIHERTWLWGVKDDFEKGFVENFSFIARKDIISFGMFNEQIMQYGGMSQEVRKRAEINKIKFEMVKDAKAYTSHKSRNRWQKHKDIAISKTQCYKLYEG